jgi:uncharacterized phage protein gp47/JayE
MTYFAPFIDRTGLNIPTYNDINDYLLEQYTSIYGQSVTGNISSSDVQSISIFALMINDSYLAAQAVFNGMSPSKAVGAQQDSLYKLNGIARNGATTSTCTVTVVGTPNFEMINRVAMDSDGNLWNLPTDFVIPPSGTIDVTAVCQTAGAINAAIGSINIMSTPSVSWTSVYNGVAASPGIPVETDSAFRARQASSVVLPSHSLVLGTLAAIASVDGVTRYGTIGIENPTGSVDSYGNPAHSISMVVEGGADVDIASAIYLNKTPGGYTNGTTTVNFTDAVTGIVMPIRFFRPTYVHIQVAVTVKALVGYTTATTATIKAAIVDYLNNLLIGESVSIAAVIAVAMNVTPNLRYPIFTMPSMQIGIVGGSLGAVDIPLTFSQVAQCAAGDVAITVV